jgi:hypothetical protein
VATVSHGRRMTAGTVLPGNIQGIEFSRKNVSKCPLNSIHTFAKEFNLLLVQSRSAGQIHKWLQRIPHMMIHRSDHVKLFPNHRVPVLLIGEYHETSDQSADYIVEPFPNSMYLMAVQYALGQGSQEKDCKAQCETDFSLFENGMAEVSSPRISFLSLKSLDLVCSRPVLLRENCICTRNTKRSRTMPRSNRDRSPQLLRRCAQRRFQPQVWHHFFLC